MQTHGWWSPMFVGAILAGCAAGAPPAARPGIDVLLDDSLHLVRGRRVGLLTNQTGVDARGTDDTRRLVDAGVRLTAIFSPEHGFHGQLDQENIEHGVDSATGVRLFSLYCDGAVRAPTAGMLESVDVMLVDLQDIGGRPYTYVSTALLALKATAAHGLPLVVLDRPNPIGELVQGPVLDTAFRSDIGMLPVPLRHGMTLAELLRMGNDLLGIGGPLVVVPVRGWRRTQWFDQTSLPWVRPSPSMPDLESATHYPGLVLFEATNLSVGRGTPVAFQVIASPWLDVAGVRASVEPLDGAVLSDTSIVPVAPPDAKYPGVALAALRLRVTHRERYDPVATAVRLLAAVRARHADSLRIAAARFDRLAGTDRLRVALERGTEARVVVAGWEQETAAFRSRRRRYLIYPAELP